MTLEPRLLKTRYRAVLGPIPDDCFFLDGALDWVQRLPTPDPPS